MDEKSNTQQLYVYLAAQNENVGALKRLVEGLQDMDSRLYNTMLIHSLKQRWFESFEVLSSLPVCQGSTVLRDLVPLTRPEDEDFVVKLVENGADIHVLDSDNNSLLHYAVMRQCLKLAQVLLEKGVDINVQNHDGDTVLHYLIISSYPSIFKRRLCAMGTYIGNKAVFLRDTVPTNYSSYLEFLLMNGADASIQNSKGHTALDLAITIRKFRLKYYYEQELERNYSIVEILYYYTYDDVVPCHVVLEMMKLKLPLFYEVIGKVREIPTDYDYEQSDQVWSAFSTDLEYLRKLVDKFDNVILQGLHITTDISLENFDFLLNTKLRNDVIEFIRQNRISHLIEVYYNKMYVKKAISEDVVIDIIYYFLSYGLQVYEEDLDVVYNNFGRCELFNILLHMDIEKMFYKKDIWLCLLYNFTDLNDFFKNPRLYSWKNVTKLLHYYSDQRLKDFCRDHYYSNRPLMDFVKTLPTVPLLQEIARNAFRNFFIKKFNIKSSCQFYTLVKRLPVGTTHKKIITLEDKLYY